MNLNTKHQLILVIQAPAVMWMLHLYLHNKYFQIWVYHGNIYGYTKYLKHIWETHTHKYP